MNDSYEEKNLDSNAFRSGFYISVSTVIITLITFGIAIFTPPLSGPFCTGDCFQYPYSEIAGRFPRDYYWMYPAMLMLFSYLVLMIHIHHTVPYIKKLYSTIGVAFAVMATLILSADYFIQVSVIQPSILAGETEGIALLTQFNPHGIFIVLEEFGFLLMSISFFALFPVFGGRTKLEKAIKLTVIAGFALAVIAFVLISVKHGIHREYRFEIAIISITWIETIVLGILLARYFKNQFKQIKNL